MLPFLSNFIGESLGSVLLLSIVIILCTMVLEDLTTVVVGVLAADGMITVPIAILSLYAGVLLGDTAFYTIGRLARSHPRLAHYVEHDLIASLGAWLERRYVFTIFSARFIPGSRIPTYVTSGFFRTRFSTFFFTILAAISIWTTALFSVSYWFGSLTSTWLLHARWGIALSVLLIFFFVARHNLLAYRAKKNEMGAV